MAWTLIYRIKQHLRYASEYLRHEYNSFPGIPRPPIFLLKYYSHLIIHRGLGIWFLESLTAKIITSYLPLNCNSFSESIICILLYILHNMLYTEHSVKDSGWCKGPIAHLDRSKACKSPPEFPPSLPIQTHQSGLTWELTVDFLPGVQFPAAREAWKGLLHYRKRNRLKKKL